MKWKQVFLRQFSNQKYGVHFPPTSLRKYLCCLTLAGFQYNNLNSIFRLAHFVINLGILFDYSFSIFSITNQLIKGNQTYQQFFHCSTLFSLFRLKERQRDKKLNYSCANYKVTHSSHLLSIKYRQYIKWRMKEGKVQRATTNRTINQCANKNSCNKIWAALAKRG